MKVKLLFVVIFSKINVFTLSYLFLRKFQLILCCVTKKRSSILQGGNLTVLYFKQAKSNKGTHSRNH